MSAELRVHAALATVISLAVIVALAVPGVVALSGAEAAAKQPKCGDTITSDTTLRKDLVDCPNHGMRTRVEPPLIVHRHRPPTRTIDPLQCPKGGDFRQCPPAGGRLRRR